MFLDLPRTLGKGGEIPVLNQESICCQRPFRKAEECPRTHDVAGWRYSQANEQRHNGVRLLDRASIIITRNEDQDLHAAQAESVRGPGHHVQYLALRVCTVRYYVKPRKE